jgi:hypothetical protein
LIKIGNSILGGGDEGVKLARLEERAGGQCHELQEMIDLSKWFDVPKQPPENSSKKIVSPVPPCRAERYLVGTTLKADVVVVYRYSVRNASIGLTRVARRAGTKQDAAATKVSRPDTTR